MLQMFEIKREQLKDIEYILPNNMILYLGDNQEFRLSDSGKTLYLMQNIGNDRFKIVRKFKVSKTMFVLRENL
jgi:hypothetical protein